MKTRTVGAVALHSTLNDEGSVSYFSLQTGQPITITRKTLLPMPAHAIDRVEKMTRRKIPGLIFGDRNNNPEPEEEISEGHSYDSAADSDYQPEDPDGDSVDDEPHDDNESHGKPPNTRDTVVTVATNEQPQE